MPARKKTTKKKATTKAVARRTSTNKLALPSKLADRYAEHINRDRATAVGAAGWPQVATSGKGFKLGNIDFGREAEFVVLSGIRQNQLFEKDYVQGQSQVAACAALDLDGDEATMAPPEGGKHTECATCPWNVFGSGKGNAKACKNQIRLVVAPVEIFEKPESKAKLAFLNLPPSAIKPWTEYVDHIGELGRPLFSVVTRFEIEPETQGFSVTPSFGGDVCNDEATLDLLAERCDGDVKKQITKLPPIEFTKTKAPTVAKKGARGTGRAGRGKRTARRDARK